MARRHTLTSRTEQVQDALRSADPADALLRLYYGLAEGGVVLFRKAFRRQLALWIGAQCGGTWGQEGFGDALAETSSVVLDGDIPELRDLALSAHWDKMAPWAQCAVRCALTHYRASDLCPPPSWWDKYSPGMGTTELRVGTGDADLGYWA